MKHWIPASIVALSMGLAGNARAQGAPSPGTIEVAIIPGGATWVNSQGAAPDFHNYDAGAAVAYNFNRLLGVEAEVTGSFGIDQNLGQFSSGNTKSPNVLGYTGNVVVNLPAGGVIPYVTGGIGGNTAFKRESLGIRDTDTFFTSNVGGGLKWFAPNGRWGVRGDYRFQIAKSKDDAAAFFGQDNRYSNRVYGGVLLNVLK